MNKRNIFLGICIGLISALTVYIFVLHVRYSKLENENMRINTESLERIDAVKVENTNLENKIIDLQHIVQKHTNTIDSLNKIKQKIIIKREYIKERNSEESIIDEVKTLKRNLRWEIY